MKTHLVIITLLFSSFSFAQMRKGRGDVFPLDRELRKGGFFIAPGATYLAGYNQSSGELTEQNIIINYESSPQSKIGGYLQLGWFHSFENNRIVDYIDFGGSYKLLRGKITTNFTENNMINSRVVDHQSVLDFNDSHIGLFFNATKTIPISTNTFISNSIGINIDNRVIEAGNYSGSPFTFFIDYPPIGITQLHYKIGFGFRAFKNLLVIPSIETPIMTLVPTKNFSPSLAYGDQQFQPIFVSLQFFFLRDDPVNCNSPVYNGPKYEVD
jgi:hypothetical protein